MKKIISCLALTCGCLIGIFGFTGCSQTEPISKTEYLLNTVCTMTLYDTQDQTILNGAFDLCKEKESLLSKTIATSDISHINHASGQWVEVSAETVALLQKAQSYYRLSNGKFAITIGAVSALWDFTSAEPTLPADTDLSAAVQTVDDTAIEINGNSVRLKIPGAQLDLGAIAKGYIADCLAAYLKDNGVTRAIINLGGNVMTIGSREEQSGWRVGIQQPFAEQSRIIGYVEVSNQTVVTSGIYERYFIKENTLYHHVLDSDTGYPVQTDLEAVVIISESSTDADALSTTALLLGSDAALPMLEEQQGVEAILIKEDGTLLKTTGVGTTIPFTLES